jgi:hypothetical protein
MNTINQTGQQFYDLGSRVGDALAFALSVEAPFNADGLEIAGCAYLDAECVERIESDEDADFYSVYWHIENEGADCFADFCTVNEARIFADIVQSRYAFRHGVSDQT